MKYLILVLLFCGLAGCATSEKQVLRFSPVPTAETRRVFFPPVTSDEVPRYVYLGELIGEQNFVDPEGTKKNVFIEALKWVVGLLDNPSPVVLQRPQSGVVDENGRILITDVSRSAVFVFDQAQGLLDVWEFAEGYKRFAAPTGIALGPAGRVFVADADLKQVVVLDEKGKGFAMIGKGQLERPTGLAWDPDAALLYVSDTQAHQIKVFDVTGRLVRTIGQRGEAAGEFNFPTYLALSRGKLIVSDTMNARVQVVAVDDSELPKIIGTRGTNVGNLVRPKGVAADAENNIYVIESYFDHLLIFDQYGRFLLPIGGTGKDVGSFYLPGGVWLDGGNRVFVADTFNGRVVVFQFLGGGSEHAN